MNLPVNVQLHVSAQASIALVQSDWSPSHRHSSPMAQCSLWDPVLTQGQPDIQRRTSDGAYSPRSYCSGPRSTRFTGAVPSPGTGARGASTVPGETPVTRHTVCHVYILSSGAGAFVSSEAPIAASAAMSCPHLTRHCNIRVKLPYTAPCGSWAHALTYMGQRCRCEAACRVWPRSCSFLWPVCRQHVTQTVLLIVVTSA